MVLVKESCWLHSKCTFHFQVGTTEHVGLAEARPIKKAHKNIKNINLKYTDLTTQIPRN